MTAQKPDTTVLKAVQAYTATLRGLSWTLRKM